MYCLVGSTSSSSGGGGGGGGGDARGGGGGGAGGGAGGRRRRAARKESRLRESRSLNRIAEVNHHLSIAIPCVSSDHVNCWRVGLYSATAFF